MADGVIPTDAKRVFEEHVAKGGFNTHIVDAYLAQLAGKPLSTRPFRKETPPKENDASRNWRAVAFPEKPSNVSGGLRITPEIRELRKLVEVVDSTPCRTVTLTEKVTDGTPFGRKNLVPVLDVPRDQLVVLGQRDRTLMEEAKEHNALYRYPLLVDGSKQVRIVAFTRENLAK